MNPKEAAIWSNKSYDDDDESWAAGRGFSFVSFTNGPHHCIVGSNDHETVVAFRGTDSLADLKTNLRMNKTRIEESKGRVHIGYHDATWSLLPQIIHLLEGDVYFCGHSMGGAMAQIAGAILPCKAVYSFNAPKCGNPTFAKHYPSQIFRFVSKYDPVQSIPSDTKDWAHVGNKILLESTGHSMERVVEVL